MVYNSLLVGLVSPLLLFLGVDGKPAELSYADGVVRSATAPVVSYTSLPRGTGPYTGMMPAVTGAATGSIRGTAISAMPPGAEATRYPADGTLNNTQPAPYLPGGGLGTNGTMPVYNVQSDYDYQSIALLLYCDWLQLDLFDTGLSQYSEQDFTQAGLTARDRELVQFLRGEILGHATMLTNIIGRTAPTRCSYRYPFTTFWEFIDFTQKISKVTESLAYGFAPHLDARATAQLVLQAVAVTGRQQMIFRQFEGLFPVPIWFTTSIPQSWAWTLIAPYINYCPGNNPRLVWQNYPALNVDTQPSPFTLNGTVVATNATGGTTNTTLGPSINAANVSAIPPAQICQNSTCAPAIVSNRTEQLSRPGQMVKLTWEKPGMLVGPNNSYITHTAARTPRWVAWVTQLNITYTPITGADGSNSSTGETTQPDFHTYAGDPAVNGTMYVAITDENLFVTPFNLSMLNPHIVAGPAVYQAG